MQAQFRHDLCYALLPAHCKTDKSKTQFTLWLFCLYIQIQRLYPLMPAKCIIICCTVNTSLPSNPLHLHSLLIPFQSYLLPTSILRSSKCKLKQRTTGISFPMSDMPVYFLLLVLFYDARVKISSNFLINFSLQKFFLTIAILTDTISTCFSL